MIKTTNCNNCSKEFTFKTRNDKPTGKFCSSACMGISKRITNPLHFVNIYHKKVVKSEGCWSWGGSRDKYGYGILGFNNKTLKAHRVSWQIHKGEIINGLFVLHTCDNRICTNPEHLFLGTAKDNLLDMIKKGRRVAAKGERHSRAKLINENVIELRSSLTLGHSFGMLSKKFNVDRGVIRDIKNGKTWAHLT